MTEDKQRQEQQRVSLSTIIKSLCGATLAVTLLLTLYTNRVAARAELMRLLHFIDENKTLGSAIYIVLFGLLTLLLIPSTFASVAAGAIFKPWPLAMLIVLLGSQFGLLMALILGRTILRPWVEAKMANSPQFKAIDGAISREGFKIVFLLRASPAFPFGICSYLLSTTSIDMVKLFPATFLGNIPGASMHTFLGNFVGSLAEVDKGVELDVKTKWTVMVVGLVILIGSVIYITMVCKRALRLALKREQQREYESLTGHQSPPSPPIVNHGSTITSTPTKSATTTSSSSSSTSKSIPSTSILADGPVTKRKSNHINKKNKSAERYDHQEHLQTVVASQPSAPKRTSPRLKAKNSNISLGRAVGGDGDVDGQFDHFSHGRAQSSHYDHIEEEFDAGAGSSSSSSHYHHQYQGEEEEEERSISPSSSLLLSASSTSALLPSSRRDGTDDEDEEEGDGFSKSEKWILSFVFIVLALALVVGLTTVHAFL